MVELKDIASQAAEQLDLKTAAVLAVALAGSTHMYTKRNEPTLWGFTSAVLVGQSALTALWHLGAEVPLVLALKNSAMITALFLFSLATSIVIYRNSPFHPLYNIPGPVLARTTQWWWWYQNFTFHPRKKLLEVHQKYGYYVRLGPNEVSIADPAMVQVVHGSSGFIKTKAYQHGLLTSWNTEADANLIAIRTHANHATRRKIWDRGFASQALPQYHPMLQKRSHQLIKRLDEFDGKKVNLHKWSGFFVYDIMADLAFGGGFGLLEAGVDTLNYLQTIVNANALHALIETMPWTKPLFTLLPSSDEIKRCFKLSRSKFEQRYKNGATDGVNDIFTYLQESKELDYEVLAKEAQLIVGAGADTTRTSLTCGMLFLTKHQEIYKRLQTELDELLGEGEISPALLERAPLLNAVINETLRLAPPITIGVKRSSPGAMIGPYFLPQETTVRLPTYAMHRDPKAFSPEPNSFRPDRFIKPSKEERFNANAFVPFAYGPYACVGKQVALQELRMTIGSIVATFDAKFADGFDPDAFMDRAHDRFLFEFDEPMEVIFTKRKGVDHGIVGQQY